MHDQRFPETAINMEEGERNETRKRSGEYRGATFQIRSYSSDDAAKARLCLAIDGSYVQRAVRMGAQVPNVISSRWYSLTRSKEMGIPLLWVTSISGVITVGEVKQDVPA